MNSFDYIEVCKGIRQENEARINAKHEECKQWVENNLTNAGIVHTKCKEDILNERFVVWKEVGIYTQHCFIDFEDAGIDRVELLDYPKRD